MAGLVRIADVHRSGVIAVHTFDQVIHVAEEGSSLLAIAIEDERDALQRLNDKIAHDAAIVWTHARAVGVEDTHHTDFRFVHALVVKTERFSDALTFVVAATNADGVDAAAIGFRLRVHLGIAIHLAGAREEESRFHARRQAQHVVGA